MQDPRAEIGVGTNLWDRPGPETAWGRGGRKMGSTPPLAAHLPLCWPRQSRDACSILSQWHWAWRLPADGGEWEWGHPWGLLAIDSPGKPPTPAQSPVPAP